MQKHPSEQPKVKCFGSSAGMTVEATTLKEGEGAATITLELAPKQGGHFIWEKKIALQLSDIELPELAAVCLGYLPKANFKRKTKGIEIIRQPNKLFVSASQGSGNVCALPVPIGQVFHVATLVLSQLQKQTGQHNPDLLVAALRGSAALYKSEPSHS